jgi:integrase
MTGRARANGEGSIFPYRNGYAAYCWVRTPNGLRKKKWVYGKTREEVHDRWIDLQKRAREGPITTSLPRLGTYLHYWLEEVIKPNSAPLTYATYETFVRVHIVPALGEKTLDKITVQVGQTWLNTVARTCQCCAQGKDARRKEDKRRCCAVGDCCQSLLSTRTLSDIRGCLRSALSHAMVEELLARNVMTLVKVPRVNQRKRKRKGKRWSTDQAKTFLVSARQDGDPFYAAYVLVIAMAMRKGEVLGLPDDAVNEDAAELDISYQLQRVGKQLLHRETKTEASEDTLPLPPIAATSIQLRQKQRLADQERAGSAWQDSGLMFTTRYGTPIEPRNFNRSWDRRCEKAGVPKITVHDGRRSCASLLMELDVHPRVTMRILRHADMKVTMEIYTEVSDEVTRKALKRLSESFDD